MVRTINLHLRVGHLFSITLRFEMTVSPVPHL